MQKANKRFAALKLDIFQASLFAEQRVSDKTAITFAGRRSYADAVLNPILNNMPNLSVRAPHYYDLQARVLHRTDAGTTYDALFLLSDDRFRILGVDEDGEETPAIGLTQAFRPNGQGMGGVGAHIRAALLLGHAHADADQRHRRQY